MDNIKTLEQKLKFISGEEKIDALNELGALYCPTDLAKAEHYVESALLLAEYDNYVPGLAKGNWVEALINYIKGHLDKSEEKYQQAYSHYEAVGEKKGIAACKRGLGRIYWDRCLYKEALEYYLESVKISEEISDEKGMADSYTLMALFYYGRGNYDETMNYLTKVLELQEKLEDTHSIALTYNRIGIVHKDKREYDRALENYFKAINIIGTASNKNTDAAIIYNNIGDCFEHKREFDKALEYFEKSKKISKETSYKDAIILSSINLGNVKAILGQYEEALATLESALQMSKETGLKIYELESLIAMARLFKGRGNYDQAFDYQQQYMALKEEQFNEEKNRQIAEMQALYESEKSKREAEIYRLKNVELANEITERKKAERALKKYQEQLEELVRERTEDLRVALAEVESLKNRLQAENIYLQEEITLQHNFNEIVGRSESLHEVLLKVEQVASSDSTVLILGETGTGKELIARAIHSISERKDRPLVKVNCAALPANLIESELFGHEKGAFTGAYARKIGRFELANNGTILLDEIGELPLELQAKLLRVLQEGEFERIGGTKSIKVDVRVIAVTNRDLEKAVKADKFRNDLYYRLNVFPLKVPPLRKRINDIPMLVNHFVLKYGKKLGKTIDQVPKEIIEVFRNYTWPGNIRELENIIERSILTSKGNKLVLGDWLPQAAGHDHIESILTLEDAEKEHILLALEQTGWRVSGEKGAARILGLPPTTLESKMRKLGLKKPHR